MSRSNKRTREEDHGDQDFCLKTPIRAQLQHILKEYPGGQLLSEMAQNSEDAGASEVVLMLDHRIHSGTDAALGGAAFVLVDNGTGLGDREWTSLSNLHQSEKQDSPMSIGSYGMGSRSYFHYSDITLVVSRGYYVGLDPLEVITSHNRQGKGGWKKQITSQDPIAAEAKQLFTREMAKLCSDFDLRSRGAMFRLPLRRAEDYAREQKYKKRTGVSMQRLNPGLAALPAAAVRML